jgi:hypothetical protein
MNKYVQSGYARAVDDHYPTVDPRCASALFENWDVPLPALDPFCSHLETGLHPASIGHLNSADQFRAIVTNPPYDRSVVDALVWDCLAKLAGNVDLVAILMRVQWDCAKRRRAMFEPPFACSMRLLFRPYWNVRRKASPIHSYQWLIWDTRWKQSPTIKHVL